MSEDNSKEYEVEAIVKDRIKKDHYDRKTRKWIYVTQYLIKWVGYEKPSWEPEENLDNCGILLNEYKRRKNESFIENKNDNNNNKLNKPISSTPMKSAIERKNLTKNRNIKRREEEEEEKEDKEQVSQNEQELNLKMIMNNYYNNINNNINIIGSNNLVIPHLSLEEENEKYFPINYYNSYMPHNILQSDNVSLDFRETFLKENEPNPNLKNFNNNIKEIFPPSYNALDIENYLGSENIDNNENTNLNIDLLKNLREKQEEIENEKNNLKLNLLQKKRKPNSSIISDFDLSNSNFSISIDDEFIKSEKESLSFFKTNDNTNSNFNTACNSNCNNFNLSNNSNIEILEMKIPEKDNEQITLTCRNKDNGVPFFTTVKNGFIPENAIKNCFENILRKFLKGKTIKFK